MQYKITFTIDEITDKKVKALPRTFNLSEELRLALDRILDEHEDEINPKKRYD